MQQEVIRDFLNLPGIAGVALIDGCSRPYFYGNDRVLNVQQKEMLAQGILQVVETVPEGFESFKFQFVGYQVHIHKLEQGIILLVLTKDGFADLDYLQAIKDLKRVLQHHPNDAISLFRLIADNPTLSHIGTSQPNAIAVSRPIIEQSVIEPLAVESTNLTPASPAPTLHDLLAALNHLSLFTTQYLGNQVVANYWKTTRPDHDWLIQFEINRSAKLNFSIKNPQSLHHSVTIQQQRWIQEWVAAYIKRCTQVVRDFPAIVQQKGLNAEQKAMLLG